MSTDATTFADSIKTLGDSLVNMKVMEVLSLTKYLKETYGLEAAAAAAAPVAQAGPAEAAPAAKTEFDVELTSFGDKKLDVVKVVKDLCGLSLMDAKKTTEAAPTVLKPGVAKDEAEAMKKKLEEAGATVTLK